MPEIAPFAALRYSRRLGPDLSTLIAPPYDVLTAADKAALLARDPHNIVAVDLPHVPPESAGPDAAYQQAATTLKQWVADGTMTLDQQPAIYVYTQEYEHAGRRYTRRKFFARMRLEEFGAGTVFPHEKTFGGPKEDRFKLIAATACQLSAVFGLYSDPGGMVVSLLGVNGRQPDATATMDGVVNRLWVLTDQKTIASVAEQMASRPVYIADGHHRYGTALNYREALERQTTGGLPADHPARFVLVGFCAMEDPGALILPTHRVLSGFSGRSIPEVLAALAPGLELSQLAVNAGALETTPPPAGQELLVYSGTDERVFAGRFNNLAALEKLAPERSPAWRQLDLAYIHMYLIDELLTRGLLGGHEPKISYVKLAGEALRRARDTDGLALLTRPCTMEQLRAVSHANDLMPHKNTFFYPKLATGLVINPLQV